MSTRTITCPNCGHGTEIYANPVPTVDVVIEYAGGLVLIERKNEPFGWALPGGFVEVGETLETAARREANEETGLELGELRLLGVYSDPARDPRQHTISTVYVAEGSGQLRAGDDAATARVYTLEDLPALCFDHARILADYAASNEPGARCDKGSARNL